ncbi:hypothetical protein KJ751_00405 [Patescibacteria group bacterium]|nr:hypothetical protein [Patescibacteria group bacterium]
MKKIFVVATLIFVLTFVAGCTKEIIGKVESVSFTYLAFGRQPVTKVVVVTDRDDKHFLGFQGHETGIKVDDVTRVKFDDNYVVVNSVIDGSVMKRIEEKDGTVKFIKKETTRIYWKEILEYKIIKRASK